MAKMNTMRKKSALKKFSPLVADKKTWDEIQATMKEDPAKYSDDEIAEVLETLMTGEENKEETKEEPVIEKKPEATHSPQERTGTLKDYEEWKVKARTKKMRVGGKDIEATLGYEKVLPGKPIKVTKISDKHADILNQQTPNSLVYFFAQGEPDFIDIEKWQ